MMNQTLTNRRSTRGFTDQPVARARIEDVLTLARTAPSGANLQPGKAHVLTGAALDALKRRLAAAIDGDEPMSAEYSYFPEPMPGYLKRRQVEAGRALYEALGIERRDRAGRAAQFAANYRFFDAPVGVIITIERAMGKGCFMDLGMFVQNLLLAAQSAGLGACGIGAMANFGPQIHTHLGLDAQEMVVCGLAIGHRDEGHPANKTRTSRLALGEFATFAGFEDE